MNPWWHQLWGGLPLLACWGWVMMGRRSGDSWASALLQAAPAWAGIAWGLSNGLSWFGILNATALKVGWVAINAVIWALVWRRCVVPPVEEKPDGIAVWLQVGTGGLLGLALVTAVVSPPVTVDVLNYHLPRQVMWLQQESLAHFLTVNDRQLMMPPLAEIIGMQFFALTGGDGWANLPQWFAYALLTMSTAACVRLLGGNRRQAWLAAWLAACLPMAYLEASNGKNDLQEALWIILILRETIRARCERGPVKWGDTGKLGLLVGLALLTKSTAFLFVPPLVVAAFAGWWERESRRCFCRKGGLAMLVVLMISAPFFTRNVAWYGTPLGVHRVEDGGHQANEVISPGIVASNILRTSTLHLSAPWPGWNRGLEGAVRWVHEGLGVSVDDRRSTCWGSVYAVNFSAGEETVAGAPWHFLLIVIGVGAALMWRPAAGWRWLGWVCLAMAAGYCIVLKWQPWGARLQEPAFMVGIVLVAGLAGSIRVKLRNWVIGVVAVGGLVCWWPSRQASARPLTGPRAIFSERRETAMYRYRPEAYSRDKSYARLIKEADVRDLFILSVHDMPYPLMRRLLREVPELRFYGAPLPESGSADPDAILVMELFRPAGLYHLMPDGRRYRLVGDSAGDGLYLPEEQVRAKGWWDRLPDFAGWTLQEGLTLNLGDRSSAANFQIRRAMSGDHAQVRFPAWSDHMRLRATVVADGVHDGELEWTLNGAVADRVALPAGSGLIKIELTLRGCVGENVLELRRNGGVRSPLVFTRLILADFTADEVPDGTSLRREGKSFDTLP